MYDRTRDICYREFGGVDTRFFIGNVIDYEVIPPVTDHADLIFNMLAWENKWRFFGASRDLCKVMAYDKEKDESIKWYATELLNEDGENSLVWQLVIPTGWLNYTRVYREIERRVPSE